MSKVKSITILVPLYNEAAVLPELFSRLDSLKKKSGYDTSILFVDDGSTDQTADILHQLIQDKEDCSAIFLSRNFGHVMALSAGLAEIKDSTDAVFIIDGDLQDPPELLNRFVDSMNEGNDVVYGIRTNRKEGFLKKICYKLYYRLLKKF